MSVFESSPADNLVTAHPHPPRSTQIAKTYRQAVQLFLTRRLPEALSTIEPVISPTDHSTNEDAQQQALHSAPIASASRSTRVKVWTFYITFLNALIELGPDEGKHAFGSSKWKSYVTKVRSGAIWEDVVQTGYHGIAEDVDADVVINLATLLITHAPSQKLTQDRLEAYLAASLVSNSPYGSPAGTRAPINAPRSSNTILRLIEIYVLHILPRNNEWDYAREYVAMNETLDNDRKEAFLLALHELRQAEQRQRQDEIERQDALRRRQRDAETEARRLDAERRKRVEQNKQLVSPDRTQPIQPRPSALRSSKIKKDSFTTPPPPSGPQRREQTLILLAQAYLQKVWGSPSLLRAVMVASFVLLALGRSSVRGLLGRLLSLIWRKVMATLGMGVKVSYI